MKKVQLTNAIVTNQYNSDECLREFKSENCTVMAFTVKVPLNSKPDCKMFSFENCVVFAKNQEKVDYVRDTIVKDAIINVEGDETKERDKKDEKKYYNKIIVNQLTGISSGPQTADTNAATGDEGIEDDLPF